MGEREHPPQDEVRRRIEEICQLMASGMSRGHINQHLKKAYGLKTRSCVRYLARARKQIYDATQRTDEDLRTESLAFYEGMREDVQLHPQWRLQAQTRIDQLMALEKPRKVALTNAEGGPATIRIEADRLENADPETLEKLVAALEVAKALEALAQEPQQ
jgi:hypothetical protein